MSITSFFNRPGPHYENGRNFAFQEKSYVYFLNCHGLNDVIELDMIKDQHRALKNTKLPRKRGNNPIGIRVGWYFWIIGGNDVGICA